MTVTYLPIRSFGDFIITASVVRQHFKERIPTVLPNYFHEIFKATDCHRLFRVDGTLGYVDQPAFFEMYKVRDKANLFRLWNDYRTLWRLGADRRYLLDYRSRRISFLNQKFYSPADNGNIYEAKRKLLLKFGMINKNDTMESSFLKPSSVRTITVFPDSRVIDKSLDKDLIEILVRHLEPFKILIAKFGTGYEEHSNVVSYSNFDELIDLIEYSDIVISSESLPYHMAYFLRRAHFVIYKKSRHFKADFMTPYMLKQKSYFVAEPENTEALLIALKNFVQNIDKR